MRVSLNTIKQYIDFDLPPVDELVERINGQLGGVEEVIDLGEKYKDAKIVRVVECEKHPGADKLFSCKIDAGTGELIQVVCGAPNVHGGMWAVWLPPESIVPSTYGTEDEFKLGARELRGIVSNGMLASARELAISDDHDGIVEINTDELTVRGIEAGPGLSFAKAYGLDDTIIEIENKMFTHRPDLFGQLGVAREISGILGHKFTSPEWYINAPEFSNVSSLPLEIFNDTPENVPRFMAVAIKDVAVKPSPLWLQIELMRLGSKAINNVVDITNYVMLMTAQPTHAYDYDKLRGKKLGARMVGNGEKVTLLNGKTYDLSEDDIVIADGEGSVGLAGIMGGGESEISSGTRNIVLEVATFDMYAVRKSSMRHGIFTDALARFNKGQSPLQNDRVLNLLTMYIKDVAGGEQASNVFDTYYKENAEEVIAEKHAQQGFHMVSDIRSANPDIRPMEGPEHISASYINQRLGLNLSVDEVCGLLSNVEFSDLHHRTGGKYLDEFNYWAPFWRMDIQEPEDVVEEVGRLYGYDKLPRELPTRSIKPAAKNPSRELKQVIREILSRAGANEVLTYSFVHERILKNAGQDTEKAYQLSNALSPDLQYYRQSLTPSLLAHVHANIKAGYDEFALFELNKAHDLDSGLNEENVPVEHSSVGLVYASKKANEGAPFYQAKAYLEFLAARLGLSFAYESLGTESSSPLTSPFEPKRSAIITDKATGDFIGVVGEYKKAVRRNFKLPDRTAGFELDTEALLKAGAKVSAGYAPLSRYPGTERDISLRVGTDVPFADIASAVYAALEGSNLETSVTPLGIYQPEDGDTKTVTVRISLTPFDRTLTGDDVAAVMSKVAENVTEATGANVV